MSKRRKLILYGVTLLAVFIATSMLDFHAGSTAIQRMFRTYIEIGSLDSGMGKELEEHFSRIESWKSLPFVECGYAHDTQVSVFFGIAQDKRKIIVLASSPAHLMLVNGHACYYDTRFETAFSEEYRTRLQSYQQLAVLMSTKELEDVITLFDALYTSGSSQRLLFDIYRKGFKYALAQKNKGGK